MARVVVPRAFYNELRYAATELGVTPGRLANHLLVHHWHVLSEANAGVAQRTCGFVEHGFARLRLGEVAQARVRHLAALLNLPQQVVIAFIVRENLTAYALNPEAYPDLAALAAGRRYVVGLIDPLRERLEHQLQRLQELTPYSLSLQGALRALLGDLSSEELARQATSVRAADIAAARPPYRSVEIDAPLHALLTELSRRTRTPRYALFSALVEGALAVAEGELAPRVAGVGEDGLEAWTRWVALREMTAEQIADAVETEEAAPVGGTR